MAGELERWDLYQAATRQVAACFRWARALLRMKNGTYEFVIIKFENFKVWNGMFKKCYV